MADDGVEAGTSDDDVSQTDDEEEDNASEDDDNENISSSISLFRFLFLPFSSPSPLIMKSFSRFTSDSFTGFTMNSSAPSSKHLFIIKNMLLGLESIADKT